MLSESSIEILGSNVRIDDSNHIIPAGFLRSPLPADIKVIIQAFHERAISGQGNEFAQTTLDIKLLCGDGTPFFARKLDNSNSEYAPGEHEEFFFECSTCELLEFADKEICSNPGEYIFISGYFMDSIDAENIDGGIVMRVEIDEVFFGESTTVDCDAIFIEFDVNPEAFKIFVQQLRESIPASVLPLAEKDWKDEQERRLKASQERTVRM